MLISSKNNQTWSSILSASFIFSWASRILGNLNEESGVLLLE